MEIEKKYFTKRQLEILSAMNRGEWYTAYDFGMQHCINSLKSLFNQGILELEEDNGGTKFFSNNLHYKFRLKNHFRLVENTVKKPKHLKKDVPMVL